MHDSHRSRILPRCVSRTSNQHADDLTKNRLSAANSSDFTAIYSTFRIDHDPNLANHNRITMAALTEQGSLSNRQVFHVLDFRLEKEFRIPRSSASRRIGNHASVLTWWNTLKDKDMINDGSRSVHNEAFHGAHCESRYASLYGYSPHPINQPASTICWRIGENGGAKHEEREKFRPLPRESTRIVPSVNLLSAGYSRVAALSFDYDLSK